MIGIVDYEAGNLRSVETAMKHLEADFFISKNPSELLKAERMIFPGVGEALSSMEVLKRTGLDGSGARVRGIWKTASGHLPRLPDLFRALGGARHRMPWNYPG